MDKAVSNIVNSLKATPPSAGLAVGVLQDGREEVFGFGRVGETNPMSPDGATLFEIGSVTKVFTAALLSRLVAQGHLALDAWVGDLIPEVANLPRNITLFALATHTSGLPKMPSNIYASGLRNRGDPYSAYTIDDLVGYLSHYRPSKLRDTRGFVCYSNLGMGLLGLIIARTLESSYQEALVSGLCAELGMKDTRIALEKEQNDRLAQPHNGKGKPAHNWHLPAFEGAGALRSTVNDLLMFLGANMETSDSPLSTSLRSCHVVRVEVFAPPGALERLFSGLDGFKRDWSHVRQGQGLGWVVGRVCPDGPEMHWHHGATGGYRAFVGFVKDSGTAVVVVANSGPSTGELLRNMASTDVIGFRILEHINRR